MGKAMPKAAMTLQRKEHLLAFEMAFALAEYLLPTYICTVRPNLGCCEKYLHKKIALFSQQTVLNPMADLPVQQDHFTVNFNGDIAPNSLD